MSTLAKKLQQSKLRITFWMKWDYYANIHIIFTIYATFENIELLPFSSEKIFLILYKCSSEQAEITYTLKEMNIYRCEDSANLHNICTI